jgi:hypothetical protein
MVDFGEPIGRRRLFVEAAFIEREDSPGEFVRSCENVRSCTQWQHQEQQPEYQAAGLRKWIAQKRVIPL